MKMKSALSIALLFISGFGFSQGKYVCKTGKLSFFGQTPMETIEALNSQASGILDTQTGDMVVSAMVKSFKFKIALMEEHFNENYIESTKNPKASFKGKIINLKDIQFGKAGVYKAVVEGDLTIKGKTQKIKTEGTVEVKGSQIMVKSKFKVTPEDHGIEIPSVVRDKIARQMEVTVDMIFDPMKG